MGRSPSRCTPLISRDPLTSSRAISRTDAIPLLARVLVVYRMTQPPLTAVAGPDVVGAPAVDDLLELGVGNPAEFEELVVEAARELPVVAAHQRRAFLAGDLVVADLVRRVRRGATDAELDEPEVV